MRKDVIKTATVVYSDKGTHISVDRETPVKGTQNANMNVLEQQYHAENVKPRNTTDIVETIKHYMEQYGLNKSELAIKCNISHQYIGRLLNGKILNAGFNQVSKIYHALGFETITCIKEINMK